ncbi:MAG: molybdopterin converting factor subunit 1 [Gammaproteobacteria bacterium]|nr:MAG: molybdopterin converting factor subunit 1 [Gammaproteobacteria bacterium]RLA57595.1 MAG: molybdopterin converting factor subunit 1 [Gammaproteobacteria bacterium]
MLKVLFFARIKEQLDCGALELEWQDAVADLDGLQEQLCAAHGDQWREVLGQDNMIRAVNQTVVDGNRALRDGDEVAFFPPVTGG